MISYAFRPCHESDHDWAFGLYSDVYRDVVERQFGSWDNARALVFFNQDWNPRITQVIVVGGTDAGLVALEPRESELWLDELQLSPRWQGHGIGTRIVRDLMQQAVSARKPLRLQVLRMNAGALRLYTRLGFAITGETATHHVMEYRPS